MTTLAFGLIETHGVAGTISPSRVKNVTGRLIKTHGAVPELTPRIITIATPRSLNYITTAQTAPVHEQQHILPPEGMATHYSAARVVNIVSVPFNLITTHGVAGTISPSRVKTVTGRLIKTHGEAPTASPGIGRMVAPDTMLYQTSAQIPHIQFGFIVTTGTHVSYSAASVVVNTRLDVQPSKTIATYKAPKTDTWQPGICNPPDVTVRYQADKIIVRMDAHFDPRHLNLNFSAARVTFGNFAIKTLPVDIVCYYAAAQVSIDDGAQRHTVLVSAVTGRYAADRVHTLTVATIVPDVLDYLAVSQVPDVHRYFVRPKFGPILELDRSRRILESDRTIRIIELTKSELTNYEDDS